VCTWVVMMALPGYEKGRPELYGVAPFFLAGELLNVRS